MRPGTQVRPSVAIIGTRGYPSFYGGFETAVRRLAPYLADGGWSVRVYGRPGGQSSCDEERDHRVETVVTKGVESKSLSTLTFGLTAVLHAVKHKPDVALIMNVANGYWLPLLKLRGIPTIVNVDGIEWQRAKWSRLGRAVFWLGARFTAWFADELVFDANAIGDYWRRTFGRSGTFIPYGGDQVPSSHRPPEFPPGRYVLVVARFVPENSIDLILSTAHDLVEQLDLDVVLVGSAPENDPLQVRARTVSQHPRIHLLGHVADDDRLFSLWQQAGVYFHGHTVGGTNPALVQAMSLGAPIVAIDTVYNREVLADAGVYAQPNQVSVCDAVKEALTNRANLSESSARRADIHYSWASVCKRYTDLLKDVSSQRLG
jgi:glycosyltransferase involved in cell wall biosynthesis